MIEYVKNNKTDVALSGEGNNAFRCSGLILELNNGSFLTLESLKIIAFANYNTTEFLKEQSKFFR